MQKARKMRILWLSLGIFASVSAAAGTALLAWLSLSGHYVWAVLVGIITAHGYYGIPFYFSAMARTGADIAFVGAVTEGRLSVIDISNDTGYTEDAVHKRLSICVRRGYITGYTLTDTGLVKSE